jgi:predicted double-glycine peptidase
VHVAELLIMVIVCAGSAAGARFAVRRWPNLRYVFVVTGFVLLWPNLLSRLLTDKFYLFFPESFLTEMMYAGAFLLVGVLAARYLNTSFRRIIFLVFTVVLSYFTLADYVFFAVAADMVRSLDGNVIQDVTTQSSGFSCVPCSLATVLRRWGLQYSEGEVAYELRTSFRGTSVPRVPGAVRKLGSSKKLQAKVIKTTWNELQRLDIPCLISVKANFGKIDHCSALVGLNGEWVIAGEPLLGILRLKRDEYMEHWQWSGYAVVIAPDFLHSFDPSDGSDRCRSLLESLGELGYNEKNGEAVNRFQQDHELEPTGVLDWRTILVIDALAGPEDRPRLSTCIGMPPEEGKD